MTGITSKGNTMNNILRETLATILSGTLFLCATSQGQESKPDSSYSARYDHAAVAASHPVASQAGLEMLEKGGNAVDAAVATSFCLSVVQPMSCGIGGGGFMVIYDPSNDETPAVALNYREVASGAVDRDYYVKLGSEDASRFGVHASGVPGTVAGLLYALEHYGTLDRVTVLAPAIRAASEGFAANPQLVGALRSLKTRRESNPEIRATSEYYYQHLALKGKVQVGDIVKNPDQARTLRLIAQHGADAFYRGEIAVAISGVMERHGGPITMDDLKAYKPRVVEPLIGTFRGYEVISMPPPSSGGVAMLQILGILDRRLDDIDDLSPTNPAYVHLLTEAMKHAFADRAEWLADSAFVEVPIERLTSAAYIKGLTESISMIRTQDRLAYGSVTPMPDDGGTSHLSVIDASGMAVACTETINMTFGSMVVVPGFGFALNNEMDDFTTIPGKPNAYGLLQSDKNLPQPGKRPLSSMSPTIVVADGKVRLVAGAAGGPRIITATTQILLNCLLFDMTPGEAIDAARIHHQWMPEKLYFENRWNQLQTISALRAFGHETDRTGSIGVAQLIQVASDGVHAASDPRGGGRPAGY
ncbi:MAG: gamma-glutamyltransferase [Planctomycetes bacterium]|nr:gamma-glutamyltransferase [Planctomycetota bacterium]